MLHYNANFFLKKKGVTCPNYFLVKIRPYQSRYKTFPNLTYNIGNLLIKYQVRIFTLNLYPSLPYFLR